MTEIYPRGGKRDGSGRPAGLVNKAKIAQGARSPELGNSYSDIAFITSVDIANNGTGDTARTAAVNTLLAFATVSPRGLGYNLLSCWLE